jgi:hypothetical protein
VVFSAFPPAAFFEKTTFVVVIIQIFKLPVKYGERHGDVGNHWPGPGTTVKLNLKNKELMNVVA